jgi:hypothetical protein
MGRLTDVQPAHVVYASPTPLHHFEPPFKIAGVLFLDSFLANQWKTHDYLGFVK